MYLVEWTFPRFHFLPSSAANGDYDMRKKRKETADAFGPIPEDALDFAVNPGDENADDALLESLDNMSEKDVSPRNHDKKKGAVKKKKGGVVRNVILVISILVFVGCGIWLVDNYIQKKKAVDETDTIRREIFSGVSFAENGTMSEYDPGSGAICRLHSAVSADRVLCLSDRIEQNANVSSGNYNKDLESIRAGITGLTSKNPDTYGWITIPDTHIDHPIVQNEDNNDWYLDHSFLGDYLVTGSIFADFRNSRTILKNFNTVLYGHNITTGDMFHDVTRFLDEDFFNSTLIYIYTMDGVFVYEPFSIFESRYDYNYFRTEFASTDEFIAFAREMRDNSRFHKDIDFISSDRMLTLSTCTNGASTQRWCLQAKLVQVIN